MKKIYLLFFLLAYECYFAASLNCINILKQNQCERLQGCEWTGAICEGSFVPSCMPPICQYVDSSTTVTQSDGTPAAPWRTITEGLNNISNNSGVVIIINHLGNVRVDMTQTVTLNSDVVIKYAMK